MLYFVGYIKDKSSKILTSNVISSNKCSKDIIFTPINKSYNDIDNRFLKDNNPSKDDKLDILYNITEQIKQANIDINKSLTTQNLLVEDITNIVEKNNNNIIELDKKIKKVLK